mmetsp:Transcript_83167/g.201600  ORF Transcript_83167/g.201600 Transcript_83167/m.201600 type:complete len:268 (+) Transcript_83167:120-923(+)
MLCSGVILGFRILWDGGIAGRVLLLHTAVEEVRLWADVRQLHQAPALEAEGRGQGGGGDGAARGEEEAGAEGVGGEGGLSNHRGQAAEHADAGVVGEPHCGTPHVCREELGDEQEEDGACRHREEPEAEPDHRQDHPEVGRMGGEQGEEGKASHSDQASAAERDPSDALDVRQPAHEQGEGQHRAPRAEVSQHAASGRESLLAEVRLHPHEATVGDDGKGRSSADADGHVAAVRAYDVSDARSASRAPWFDRGRLRRSSRAFRVLPA